MQGPFHRTFGWRRGAVGLGLYATTALVAAGEAVDTATHRPGTAHFGAPQQVERSASDSLTLNRLRINSESHPGLGDTLTGELGSRVLYDSREFPDLEYQENVHFLTRLDAGLDLGTGGQLKTALVDRLTIAQDGEAARFPELHILALETELAESGISLVLGRQRHILPGGVSPGSGSWMADRQVFDGAKIAADRGDFPARWHLGWFTGTEFASSAQFVETEDHGLMAAGFGVDGGSAGDYDWYALVPDSSEGDAVVGGRWTGRPSAVDQSRHQVDAVAAASGDDITSAWRVVGRRIDAEGGEYRLGLEASEQGAPSVVPGATRHVPGGINEPTLHGFAGRAQPISDHWAAAIIAQQFFQRDDGSPLARALEGALRYRDEEGANLHLGVGVGQHEEESGVSLRWGLRYSRPL